MDDQPPLRIFIVYAREDAEALKELRVQFIPVARSERLEFWYDGEILPGQHWDNEIKTHLSTADIILLFISKYFFASEYIQSTELKEALARHEASKSVVVPVIVRPCVWQDAFEVSKFQALPANAHPIYSSQWRDTDEALVSVVEGVKKVAKKLRADRAEQERLELVKKQKLVTVKVEREQHQKKETTERLGLPAREQHGTIKDKPFPTRLIASIGAGLLGLVLIGFLANKFSEKSSTNPSDGMTQSQKNPIPIIKDSTAKKIEKFVDGGFYGFKQENKVIIKPTFDFAYEFSEGKAVVRIDSKCYAINNKGDILFDVPCDRSVGYTNNRLRAFNDQGLGGYIDENGVWIIKPKFTSAWEFYEGRAKVGLNGKIGFIDTLGNIIVPIIYDESEFYKQGRAILGKNNKYEVVNLSGEIITMRKYDFAFIYSCGYLLAVRDNKFFYLDLDGQETLNTMCTRMGGFDEASAAFGEYPMNLMIILAPKKSCKVQLYTPVRSKSGYC